MQARFCLNVGCSLDEMKSDGPRGLGCCAVCASGSSLECGVYLGFGKCLWRTGSGRVYVASGLERLNKVWQEPRSGGSIVILVEVVQAGVTRLGWGTGCGTQDTYECGMSAACRSRL